MKKMINKPNNKSRGKNKSIASIAGITVLSIGLQCTLPLVGLADELKTEPTEQITQETASKLIESTQPQSSITVGTVQSDKTESSEQETSSTETIPKESESESGGTSSTEKPVQPTEPSSPVEPTEPTEPEKPVKPTEPTEPEKPTKPTEPETKPTEPETPSKEEIEKEKEKAKELSEGKTSALNDISGLNYLSQSEKDALKGKLDGAKTIEEVNSIKDNAIKTNQDNYTKLVNNRNTGLQIVSELSSLSDSQRVNYSSQIQKATTTSEVDSIVNQAKNKNTQNKINNAKEQERLEKEQAERDRLAQIQNSKDSQKDSNPIVDWSNHSTSDNNYVSGANIWGNGTVKYSKNQTTQAFINKIGEDARELGLKNDIYASVMIAQAILESGSGNSGLSAEPNFNLFGIKGEYKGQSVGMSTQEDMGGGSMTTINAGFRKYPSYKESLEDYVKLIKEGISGNKDFYKGTWKSETKSYKDATKFLTGKYATDTIYNEKLNGLIETYGLEKYDHKEMTKSEVSKIAGNNSLSVQEKIEAIGKTQLGVPYIFGGSTPGVGLDCSSFVQFVFAEVGISLPRTAQAQYEASTKIPRSALEKGDLVFFEGTYDTPDYITHIGIYIGDNKYIQEGGANVHITDLDESYSASHLAGFGRVTK